MGATEYRLLDGDGDTVYEATESTLDATGLGIIVEQWGLANQEAKKAQDRAGRWSWYLQRRMEAIGATESVGGASTALLEPGTAYDQVALLPILEAEGLTVEELEDDGAVVLAYEKVVEVETRFNLTKLKKFARRGAHIQAIIEDAKTPTPARLKLKAR